MKDENILVRQMLDAAAKISTFVAGADKEHFSQDDKTQSAVILQLMLIGELSKNLSEQTKSKANLPWREISGFRDRAIHNYFQIDLDIVWVTITNDLPVLVQELQKLL